MNIILKWVFISIVILACSYVFPGIHVANFWAALLTAVVLGLINLIFRPILLLLTLPINILTLGLFTFVINALLILLASALVPGFQVASFWWALLMALVLSVANSLLHYANQQ
jgi:putative membrane protein